MTKRDFRRKIRTIEENHASHKKRLELKIHSETAKHSPPVAQEQDFCAHDKNDFIR